MFTGIIQAMGQVTLSEVRGDALTMKVYSPGFFEGLSKGDSVANDGVCLSIESLDKDSATFCLMHQTLTQTTFGNVSPGKILNLEKACLASSFLGGHFVLGHVDSIARVSKISPRESGVEVDIEMPPELMRYMIRRGSVALNGISLTIAEKFEKIIRVCIIPETLSRTNLKEWREGTEINVEVDMLGKYMENYLSFALREIFGKEFPEDSEVNAVDKIKFFLKNNP